MLRWAAPAGLTATFHWHNNRSVHHLLDVLERVNRDTPVAALRWSIAHLTDGSPENLARMKALGVGWLMQNALYFRGMPSLPTGSPTLPGSAADSGLRSGWYFHRGARRAAGDVVQSLRISQWIRWQDRAGCRHACPRDTPRIDALLSRPGRRIVLVEAPPWLS